MSWRHHEYSLRWLLAGLAAFLAPSIIYELSRKILSWKRAYLKKAKPLDGFLRERPARHRDYPFFKPNPRPRPKLPLQLNLSLRSRGSAQIAALAAIVAFAVVWGLGSSCKEVELLIRMTITRNSITGYELNCSVVPAGPYLTLVRWNGPLNNFTYLVRNTITCVNGDVLKLTAVGNTFTVYKNGGQVLQGTDATFQKGSPGVGFYNSVDNNWSGFGLSNFSASNVGSSDTTPPRIQDHD